MRAMLRFSVSLLALSLLCGCGDKTKETKRKGDDDDSKRSEETAKKEDQSLSRASRRLACETLKQELTIDVYVTRDKLTEKAITATEALLKSYAEATLKPDGASEALKSKIKTRVIEVKNDADKTVATAAGLQEQTFSETQGPNSALVMRGFFGFVLTYGAEKEVISWWPPDDPGSLEFYLTSKGRELRARADRVVTRIGFVSQKDELGPDDPDLMPAQAASLTQIFGQYFPQYKIEPVDLKNGDAAIDAEIRGLIVTQPGRPYREKELRRIDEFVMRGSRGLVIAASAVNMTPGDLLMMATLDRRGLEKLVAGYGMDMQNDAVLDYNLGLSYQGRSPIGANTTMRMPAIFVSSPAAVGTTPYLDTSFAPFFRLGDLAFPFPSPIVLHPEKQPGAKQRIVARTSAQATLDARGVKSMLPSDGPPLGGAAEERVIAAATEGEISTAFPSGDNLGIVVPAKSPTPSRVLLVAASQFFVNPFVVSSRPRETAVMIDPGFSQLGTAYAQGNATRLILAFRGCLDWISADEEMAELAGKLKPVVRKDTPAAPAPSSKSLLDMFGK